MKQEKLKIYGNKALSLAEKTLLESKFFETINTEHFEVSKKWAKRLCPMNERCPSKPCSIGETPVINALLSPIISPLIKPAICEAVNSISCKDNNFLKKQNDLAKNIN